MTEQTHNSKAQPFYCSPFRLLWCTLEIGLSSRLTRLYEIGNRSLFAVDPILMTYFHLLPRNLSNIILGSCFLFPFSFTFLASVAFCIRRVSASLAHSLAFYITSSASTIIWSRNGTGVRWLSGHICKTATFTLSPRALARERRRKRRKDWSPFSRPSEFLFPHWISTVK